MTVHISIPGRVMGGELGRRSTVRMEKIIGAAGPCAPGLYHTDATVSDDFNRANTPGFGLASWREIQNTIIPPRNTVSITNNELVEIYQNPAGGSCVGGIRQDIAPGDNWRVSAEWGTQDNRQAGSNGPRMMLCGPISQTNPADPAPPINQIQFFNLVCEHSLTTPATYVFTLQHYPTLAFFGSFTTTAFGAGHTFALEVFCNNASSPTSKTIIRCLVDGIVRITQSSGVGNVPAGLPGCGIMYEQALGTPLNVASLNSWTAERLVI